MRREREIAWERREKGREHEMIITKKRTTALSPVSDDVTGKEAIVLKR